MRAKMLASTANERGDVLTYFPVRAREHFTL
jgi:hypothetical protein